MQGSATGGASERNSVRCCDPRIISRVQIYSFSNLGLGDPLHN